MIPRFLVVLAAVGALARADVTLRQTMQSQLHIAPPGVGAGAVPGLDGPLEIVVRLKGSRAYCRYGAMTMITDAGRKEVTLLDPANQRFATTSMADYVDRLKKLTTGIQAGTPEAARQMMAGVQVHIESHETDQSAQILGIQAQAREIEMSMTIPMPMGGRGGGGLEISGKFELWRPTPAEVQRVPALGELMSWYNLTESQGMGPGALMGQMFAEMPGMGNQAGALAAEMAKGGSFALRLHGSFSMPGLAAIMERAKANGANVPDMPGIDKPLFEMTTDLVQLNSDPVSDADVQVPAGYQAAPVDELIKLMLPAAPKRPGQ